MKLKLCCPKCKITIEFEPVAIVIGDYQFIQRPEYYCAKCHSHCTYYEIKEEDGEEEDNKV